MIVSLLKLNYKHKIYANEINTDLKPIHQLFPKNVKFTYNNIFDLHYENKFDFIFMNPPFSITSEKFIDNSPYKKKNLVDAHFVDYCFSM